MHDILQFHSVRGSSVQLSESCSKATRIGDFCNGIAFSSQPLKIGQKVCLELSQTTDSSGALRLGVTTHDPAKLSQRDLPRYACPELTNKEGYWARGLNENYAQSGNRITFYVNRNGQLHFFVNNEHKGALLNHIPLIKPLWALFDIYGNTNAAKLVHADLFQKSCQRLLIAARVGTDEAPVEIVARGSEALKAYQLACESGTQPVFRTRLMLVGQDRVGKTSLKKSLTGQSFDSDEQATMCIDISQCSSADWKTTPHHTTSTLPASPRHDRCEGSTDGIDLSASCSFNLRDRTKWKLAVDSEVSGSAGDERMASVNTLCGIASLEEEYNRAIANNIVQELLYQRKTQREADSTQKDRKSADKKKPVPCKRNSKPPGPYASKKSEEEDREAERSTALPSHGAILSATSESLRSSELYSQEMPDRVVELVDELLAEKDRDEGSDRLTGLSNSPVNNGHPQNGANIVLNIWDFAGQAGYYTTHQVFLSSRAVYIIVFNLCHDLAQPSYSTAADDTESREEDSCADDSLSHLEYMDFWMNSIHAHTATNTRSCVDNSTLSPPIFIVGTHRNALHADPDIREKKVAEKFNKIERFVENKIYRQHIVKQMYAVENNLQNSDDEQVALLRRHIEEVASKETYMGEQMPIKWLRFEQVISEMTENGTHFSSLEQMEEVAKDTGVQDSEELKTVLEFYHDLGSLIYFGGGSRGQLDSMLRNTVILQPKWLIDMFKRVINAHPTARDQGTEVSELWHRLETVGILEERLVDQVWADIPHQKYALLALMQKFDLISERIPKMLTNRMTERVGQAFYVPSSLKSQVPSSARQNVTGSLDIVFYLDFNGFLPEGVFHRVVTRAIRWSQDCGGHDPVLSHAHCRFFLDAEHDFILAMMPARMARIKVMMLRVVDLDESENESSDSGTDKTLPPPKPVACAKVRNFLESTLADLRELWMKRISYQTHVTCPCDRPCQLHGQSKCLKDTCLHFLNLDECLSNKVVCCEHRRVRTSVFRKWFPSVVPAAKTGPVLPEDVVKQVDQRPGNIEASMQGVELPTWCKSAAKLLSGGVEGQDWLALARTLGYKKAKLEKLGEDVNPGLALITDWIVSCGNTPLSVDMLITCLEQLHRDDIVDIIQKGQESDTQPADVFISYQWDSQDEVTVLREHLERAGYRCWMDIGQMGGGDVLYERIDQGIRNAKVVLACVSPKYVVSHHCHRELGLADLLRKPVIPIMYERTPWPPPGAMALMFAGLCYTDMKGIGGHGGCGIHADLESKHREIIQRVSNFATPAPCLNSEMDTKVDKQHHQMNHFNFDGSLHSSDSTRSLLSVPPENIIIPGYSSDAASVMRPNAGGIHVRANVPGGTSAHPVPHGQGIDRAMGRVEQVHVAKCAVCTIL